MPSPYIQLLLVNMLLASLISTVVLGAPMLPAVAGALGAGALLYARHRAKHLQSPASESPSEAGGTAPGVGGEAAPSCSAARW